MSITRYILFFSLLISSSIILAGNNSGGTNKTKPIIGFPPLIKSIGTISDPKNHHLFDEQNKPITSVNNVLYVASIYCQFKSDNISDENNLLDTLPFFHFSDKDGDNCLTEEINDIQWFILSPKNDDLNPPKSWDDFDTTEIVDSAALISPLEIADSKYTSALRIPKAAVGKRIGFIYTPKSSTGHPAVGNPIKVWDLGYFFGQAHYDVAGFPLQGNDGDKLEKINIPSGEGIVMNDLTLPSVDNLFMEGIFLPGKKINAVFDIQPQEARSSSRLWWGRIGTTHTIANFQNPDYSTGNESPILTEDNISEGYEVTVLPIKKEEGYFVVGQAVTVTSDDPENQFSSALTITELTFNSSLSINQEIGATYQFGNGGNANAADESVYTWRIKDNSNQWQVLETNKIITSGIVPNSPKLEIEQAGKMLSLIIEPHDQFGNKGEAEEISSNIESLVSVNVTPDSLLFNVGELASKTLKAEAIFSNQTKIDITEHDNAVWSSNNDEILVSNGQASLVSDNQFETKGIITFTYGEKSDTAEITVNPNPPSIENLQFSSPLSVGTEVEATYQFNSGGKKNSEDQSSYNWNIKNENGTNNISLSGNISVSGTIPKSPAILLEHSGAIINLSVTPKDQTRTGTISTITDKTPSIQNIAVTPPSVDFYLSDTYPVVPLEAIATYDDGNTRNVTSVGSWTSNNFYISLDGNNVSIRPNLPDSLSTEVTYRHNMGMTFNVPIKVHGIEKIAIEPSSIEFTVGDTHQTNVSAIATYSNQSTNNISNSGTWSSDIDGINISQSGAVSISSAIDKAATGTITFTHNVTGQSATIPVIVHNTLNIKLDATKNNAIAGEESNIIKAIVTDQDGNLVANKRVNFTANITTGVTIQPSTGTTNSLGEITANVSKNSGGVVELTATVYDTEKTAAVTLSFITVSSQIAEIRAPNDYTFRYDSGFPTTGYTGAKFLIMPVKNIPNSSFSWSSSDSNAASVDNEGNVTLKEYGLNKTVQITARNDGSVYRYSFKVTRWFKIQSSKIKWQDLNTACKSQASTAMATQTQLSAGQGKRGVGSFWGEWGGVWYSTAWTETHDSPNMVYIVDLDTGNNSKTGYNAGNNVNVGVCVKK